MMQRKIMMPSPDVALYVDLGVPAAMPRLYDFIKQYFFIYLMCNYLAFIMINFYNLLLY
jgi:hypothetical protein